MIELRGKNGINNPDLSITYQEAPLQSYISDMYNEHEADDINSIIM